MVFGSVIRVPFFASYGFVVRACSLRVSIVLFFYCFSGVGEGRLAVVLIQLGGGGVARPTQNPMAVDSPLLLLPSFLQPTRLALPSPTTTWNIICWFIWYADVHFFHLHVSIAFSMHTRG